MLDKSGKFKDFYITLKQQSEPVRIQISNEKARKELGLVFRSVEESLIEMISSLRDMGVIQKKTQ